MDLLLNLQRKLSSLVTLVSFTLFKDSLGIQNPFNGLVNDLWEGGRVLTQEQCYLDLVWMVYLLFEHGYLFLDLKLFHYRLLTSGANFHIYDHWNLTSLSSIILYGPVSLLNIPFWTQLPSFVLYGLSAFFLYQFMSKL